MVSTPAIFDTRTLENTYTAQNKETNRLCYTVQILTISLCLQLTRFDLNYFFEQFNWHLLTKQHLGL